MTESGKMILFHQVWATLHIESQLGDVQILGELKHIGQPFVLGTVAMGE